MSCVLIATKCNGPLEAAHVSIDDDRYHTMENIDDFVAFNHDTLPRWVITRLYQSYAFAGCMSLIFILPFFYLFNYNAIATYFNAYITTLDVN